MNGLIEFKPEKVCSQRIAFTVEGGVLTCVEFEGGCEGNLSGIARLSVGLTPEEVIALLKGIDCGGRGTSCPDQFAKALEAWKG